MSQGTQPGCQICAVLCQFVSTIAFLPVEYNPESDSDSHQLNLSSEEVRIISYPSGATTQHHNPNVLRHEAKSIIFMGNHLEGQLRTAFPKAA